LVFCLAAKPPIDLTEDVILPGRVNKILDTVGNSQLEVNVNTPDARHLLSGFEKIANRVTTGIILAALIMGAALLMRIDSSSFQVFGYPGFTMICFLIAIGGSAWLILGILWRDYQDKHKLKK
jgi:ubiquinone biosynthesis protein